MQQLQARQRLLILIEQQALSVYDELIEKSLSASQAQYGERRVNARVRVVGRDAKT